MKSSDNGRLMRMHPSRALKEALNISNTDYADVLKTCAEKDMDLGEALLQKKLVSEDLLLEAYARVYDMDFQRMLPVPEVDDRMLQVPSWFLKKHLIAPFRQETAESAQSGGKTVYTIAVNHPSRFQALDDLLRLLGAEDFRVVLSTRESILGMINLIYEGGRDSAEQLVQDMEESDSMILDEIQDTADLLDDTSDAPIIRLVNHVLTQSIKARASDIHIEPYQDSFKIRYRVDGILYDLLTPPKWVQPALISRIKVMAKMNIAEKRLPQDGRLDVRMGDQDIDVRVSTLPTTFGERWS